MIKNLSNENLKNDFIIENMIKSEGLYCLLSKPKAGKSFLALQLANSICNTTNEFLNNFANSGSVLYISTELSENQLYSRSQLANYEFKDNFFIVSSNEDIENTIYSYKLDDEIERDIKDFAQLCHKGFKLVIIDMIKDIDYGYSTDENSYKDMNKVLRNYRNLCKKYGVTILLVHHINKNGKTLGSTAIDGSVDGTLTLHKHSDYDYTLEYISRDYPSTELSLSTDENMHFTVVNNINSIIDESILELEKKIFKDKEYIFTPNQAVADLNLKITCVQFGKLLNKSLPILKSHGYTVENIRNSKERKYKGSFEEPPKEEGKNYVNTQ